MVKIYTEITPSHLPLGERYFRLTNEKENHRGFQYKTGLNVDTNPFVPRGMCQQGGLYFFSEEQLEEFYTIGGVVSPKWIREVFFTSETREARLACSRCSRIYVEKGKYKADKFILGEREEFDSVLLEWIKEGKCDGYTMDDAAKNGHLDVMKYLFETVGAKYTHYAMDWAAQNGHLEVVKYLNEVVHAPYTYKAIDYAAENGHLEIFVHLR